MVCIWLASPLPGLTLPPAPFARSSRRPLVRPFLVEAAPVQPILLCAHKVDAVPIFDTLDSSQRAVHAVTDIELRCPALSGPGTEDA